MNGDIEQLVREGLDRLTAERDALVQAEYARSRSMAERLSDQARSIVRRVRS